MAAHTSAFPAVGTRSSRVPMRHIKVAVAAAVSLAGGYGLLCERGYVVSSNAVVSAYVLDVRTPIDGVVTELPKTAGVAVVEGQVLGHVENSRVDHQQLSALRTQEAAARIDAEALVAERAALEAQRRKLLGRAGEHRVAVESRLALQVDQASRVLAAQELTLKQAMIELNRGRSLHDAGILATAVYDRTVSAQMIATEQVEAQRAQLGSLRVQAAAAARGVIIEPGTGTDVAYSRQRADEIAMRLAENTRALAAAQAQAREAQLSLAVETQRANLLERSDLVSPISGVLWNLNSVTGERAATGDTVLSVVDCRRQLLLVSIPQDRVPEVALRQRASFRLSGESVERFGTVLSVSADTEKENSHKFASIPFHTLGEQLATVVIGLDSADSKDRLDTDACIVGRAARVLVPTMPSNVAGRLFRRYF